MPLTVMKTISPHLYPEQLTFFFFNKHVKRWEHLGIVSCAKLPLPPLVNALVGLFGEAIVYGWFS